MVEDAIIRFAFKHQKRVETYKNVEIISLLDNNGFVPRLKIQLDSS